MERIDELQKLLQEDPDDPFLHYATGLERLKKLQYQEAIASFTTCLEKDPAYTAAYYQLGLVFMELDIVDVAARYLTQGLHYAREKKDFKSAAEFEEQLDALE